MLLAALGGIFTLDWKIPAPFHFFPGKAKIRPFATGSFMIIVGVKFAIFDWDGLLMYLAGIWQIEFYFNKVSKN